MLVIGVSTVISRVSLLFSLSDSSNGWNWFECQVFLSSQTLIDVTGQVIIGFISFGSLHIHTTGLEPWQWYVQVQHFIDALIFFQAYDHHRDTYPYHGTVVLVGTPNIS